MYFYVSQTIQLKIDIFYTQLNDLKVLFQAIQKAFVCTQFECQSTQFKCQIVLFDS